MNQQNPYGGEQPQGWGPQPQQHPHAQMPGADPGMQAPQGQFQPSTDNPIVSEASLEVRSRFIERTYMHLAGAIAVFVAISAIAQMIPGVEQLVQLMLSGGQLGWLVVLGLFMGVSFIADKWAKSSESLGMQYAGLGLYTVAEAVIFVPMIFIARLMIGDEAIFTAGGVTLAMFAAMTAYVFISKKDFSFMRGALAIGGIAAMGLILASAVFGFELGMLFSVGMVVLACGYILYHTGNVLHHYRVNQHVAAALALFSAVALLFWYILRIFMSRR